MWISELRQDLGIRTSLGKIFRRAAKLDAELRQLFLQLALLSFELGRQNGNDLLVKLPEVFGWHCLEFGDFHGVFSAD